jgi:hypothetical protein
LVLYKWPRVQEKGVSWIILFCVVSFWYELASAGKREKKQREIREKLK